MKLATAFLAATSLIVLSGCNQNAGNNSMAANSSNAAAPAAAPAMNNAAPAPAAGGNAAKPADQPADMNMDAPDGGGGEDAGAEANASK